MNFTLAQRLLAAGALCLAALVGLVIMEGNARAAGAEVILRMQPVDPRALLTGHYIQLSFAEQLAPGEPCPVAEPERSELGFFQPEKTKWLALAPDGELHKLVGEYATKAEAQQHGPVVARGRAHCTVQFVAPSREGPSMTEEVKAVVLVLPVDRFHADQDEAEALERILRDRVTVDRLAAILSVSANGDVRTKGIMVDGKRVELTWF